MAWAGATMKLSEKGLDLIKLFEGCKLKMYKDQAGYPTIGIGHKLTPEELKTGLITIYGKTHLWANGLTEEQIEDLKYQDADYCEAVINAHVKVLLNQYQYDAIVSFIFNVGVGAFLRSTLLKKINEKRFKDVPNEINKWTFITSNGKKIVSNGLKNRRDAEIKLWQEVV